MTILGYNYTLLVEPKTINAVILAKERNPKSTRVCEQGCKTLSIITSNSKHPNEQERISFIVHFLSKTQLREGNRRKSH